ncbi:MAG: M23 family metallopeptidase [Phycisphaerae bacterium]|nr:M23 family metallopeptidase [Gemmatimonadaceae bacterium]
MTAIRSIARVLTVLALPSTVASQAKRAAPPEARKAGSLFRVRVLPTQCASVRSGRVAGEPLHFHQVGDTSFALAAVPIDSARGISLYVVCANGDSSVLRLATQAGAYRLERLRVAPSFSAAPDSALALRMRREAAQASEVSKNAHETPRMWSSPFVVPRTSRITSGFGSGRTFNTVVTSRHMGTDYAGAVGAPVRAANRGVVRLVGGFYLGGNVIYIDHGEGIVTAYLHLSKQLVAVGDTVSAGAVIGHVGATGRVTGPHLHFIVRYGSVTVDAASLWGVR